jgi:hypothetical protein
MKAFKPRATSRPSPEAALAAAAEAAPQHPPATVQGDRTTTLNLRVKEVTIRGLAEAARLKGLTQKQVVIQALKQAGVTVSDTDLEDRTPRRRL